MTAKIGTGGAAGPVRRETPAIIVAEGFAPTHVSELSWRVGALPLPGVERAFDSTHLLRGSTANCWRRSASVLCLAYADSERWAAEC